MNRTLIFVVVLLLGCSGNAQKDNTSSNTNRSASDDIFDIDDPEEEKYCEAAAPFFHALAANDYSAAFEIADPLTFADVHAMQFKRETANQKLVGSEIEYDVDDTDRTARIGKQSFVNQMKENDRQGKLQEIQSIFVEGMWEGEVNDSTLFHCPTKFPHENVKAIVIGKFSCEMTGTSKQLLAEKYGVEIAEIGQYASVTALVLIVELDGKLKVAYFQNGKTGTSD